MAIKGLEQPGMIFFGTPGPVSLMLTVTEFSSVRRAISMRVPRRGMDDGIFNQVGKKLDQQFAVTHEWSRAGQASG